MPGCRNDVNMCIFKSIAFQNKRGVNKGQSYYLNNNWF